MKLIELARMAAAAVLLCGLAACGEMQEGFDKGFNESWAKSMKEGCMKSASASAGAVLAEQYCSCMIEELAPLSTKEKMEMKPDSPAVEAVANKCLAKIKQ
jgi:hypothetical protein